MNVCLLIPAPKLGVNIVRDVLYGCWCKGKRIGGATVPPLTILSVATVLNQDGNNVKILDAQGEQIPLDGVKKIIKKYDVLILLTSTMTFNEDSEILAELKKSHGSLTTIVFGSHPTFMPEYSLNKEGVDIIVKKEPEFIIRDVVRAIRTNKSWEKVKGIGFKKKGKLVINPDYPLIRNLDELPIPNRKLLPKSDYFNPIILRYPYTTSETSRGCPGKCTFCTAPKMYGPFIRFWSAKKVIEEINLLVEQGYKEVYYRDETFTSPKKRNLEVFNHIIKNKLDVTWVCNTRSDTIDKETLALMKKSGCHTIKVGVESGVQSILDKSHKAITLEQTRKLFRLSNKLKIRTHAHLMLGMPGETKQTIQQTIKFVKDIDPDTIDVGICTPYPGTELFEEVKKKSPNIGDGTSVDLSNLHTDGTFNEYYTDLKKEEIEKALSDFYKQFYMRPKHILKNLSQIKSFSDFKRISSASLSLLNFMSRRNEK